MAGKIGTIGWLDLTVPDANHIRDFYKSVIGWQDDAFDMGEYSDYMMKSPDTDDMVSGICHARGDNADLPAQWLVYIYVENLENSVEQCGKLGGKALTPVKQYGEDGKYCIIQDPAGAVMALYEDLS